MAGSKFFIFEEIRNVMIVNIIPTEIHDELNIQMMGDELFSLVDAGKTTKMLVDFSVVTSLAAAFLGKMITLNRKLNFVQGKLVICGLQEEMRNVFSATRLNRIIDVADSRESGLKVFR